MASAIRATAVVIPHSNLQSQRTVPFFPIKNSFAGTLITEMRRSIGASNYNSKEIILARVRACATAFYIKKYFAVKNYFRKLAIVMRQTVDAFKL